MHKLVLGLFIVASALPAFAVRRITVEQLERVLSTAQGKADADVAKALADLELTERLSSARMERLRVHYRGDRTQQALLVLADTSAFLDPPAAEVPATAMPDAAAQHRMMAQTVNYLGKTLPLLPNLFATRETMRFEDRPGAGGDVLSGENPLRSTARSSVTVFYRDGREFMDAGAVKDNKPQPPEMGLTTWGEFGPILGTVVIDAARSKLTWSHWELSGNRPEAVFSYFVPKEKSHYDVRFCCVAESYGMEINVIRQRTGYHGEMTVDPNTGTILRLTVESDMDAGNPIGRASIAVEYGTVEIGGKPYYCPVRSVALARAPDLKALHDMLFPASPAGSPGALPARRDISLSTIAQGPQQTLLNDVSFSHYHLFRAESRVLSEKESKAAYVPVSGQPGQPAGAATADVIPSLATAKPADEAFTEAANAAASASGAAPEPAATPAAAPAPDAELLEISVSPVDHLPRGSAAGQSAAPGAGYTLHMTGRLVDVGVVALDKKGRPVTNLKAEDFEINDNGVKQDLRSFGQATTAAAKEPAAAAAQPEGASSQPDFSNRRVSPVNPTAGAGEGNTIVLLIDSANLAVADFGDARDQMLRFLHSLRGDERVALYVMKTHGFEVLEEGTTDHGGLAAKLTNWRRSAQDVTSAQDEEGRNRQQLETVHSVEDLLSVNGNGVNNLDPGSQTEALDPKLRDFGVNPGRDALSMLVGVARHLATVPGHKSLVWVTSDNVLADWNKMSVSIDKGSKVIEASALRAQEAMNDAHTSVYPLDASRLEGGVIDASIGTRNVELSPTNRVYQGAPGVALETEVEGPEATVTGSININQGRDLGTGRLTAQMQQDMHPIQGAFREVADATGGRVFRRSSDIVSEIASVAADGRATYLLSFTPSQPADDTYHLLTVKVAARRDITLRYRTGYQYKKEAATMKDRFSEAVWAPLDANEIAVTAYVVPAPKGSTLKINIAATDVALAQHEDLWADKLDIFLAQRDDVGLHAKITGQSLHLKLKPGTYQRLLQDGIPFDQPVEVKPETGSMRILVVDENSGRMGSITVPAAAIGAKQ